MGGDSKFRRGFTGDENDFGKMGAFTRKELTGKGQGKNNTDDKVTTLRMKHSATEQRRRSKINERFQILQDLIPQRDHRREKASLLLEVIEYIQSLHEKVQKYETDCHEGNQENIKLMPWESSQGFWSVRSINDGSHIIKNNIVPGDDLLPVVPVSLTGDQSLSTSENLRSRLVNQATSLPTSSQPYTCGLGYSHRKCSPFSENVASRSLVQWQGSGSASADDPLHGQELIIDEGTISISNAYSQWLLSSLSQAMENMGIDLSKACISVQINLGKRAFNRREPCTMDSEESSPAGQNIGGGALRVGSSGEEQDQGNKRPKLDKSP